MKNLILLLLVTHITLTASAQQENLPDPEAYFVALIVADIDVSISWYSEILGYEVLSKKEFTESGFKQANLKRGTILLELIQLNSALNPQKAIPDFSNKTRLPGIFKFGFLITDFDVWISHLSNSEVEFHGEVVTDENSGKRMVIIKDPNGNRVQLFEK